MNSKTLAEQSLLLTLDDISELAAGDQEPRRALTNITALVGNRFGSDVCSIYLLEPDGSSLVLAATVGLNQHCVGVVRMALHEGLTGLVAERRRPVNIDDASRHPRFKYFPEAGEDPYHSYLGVPIIHRGKLQGVLVVQTVEPRRFSDDEWRMLVIAGRQLGPLTSRFRGEQRAAPSTPTPSVGDT